MRRVLVTGRGGQLATGLAAALPGVNHFSIVDALVTRGTRVNRLARELVR